MSRLLALALLALAAPGDAAAEQVHPCQAQTPPCSLAMAQARHYLDELDRKAGYAPTTPRVAPQVVASNSRAAAPAQAHPCQAETPPCSLAMAQARHYLDELDRQAGNFVAPPGTPLAISPELAEARRATEEALRASRRQAEWIREAGPGVWETPAERAARRNSTPEPRHHVPHPFSRELLTGAVNPCDGAYASCPPELDSIYNGLSRAWRHDDQSMLEYYQRSLRHYYDDHRPDANPCNSVFASCPPELNSIYNGLSRARRHDNQSKIEYYQRKLRNYYEYYRP